MCGIVAVFGMPNKKMVSVFETMLAVDVVRGKDSTGVAAITKNNDVFICKDIVYPLELLRSEDYNLAITRHAKDAVAFIGHNRWATRGEVSKRNAHPFHVGNITMVHNGTLTEYLKPDKLAYRTDSLSLANAIAKKGIDWTWGELVGPASVVYWDEADKTLNMISNGQRPIHFAYVNNGTHVMIASEAWTIEDVCARYNIRMERNNCYVPNDHVLFSFFLNDNGFVEDKRRKLLTHWQIGNKWNRNEKHETCRAGQDVLPFVPPPSQIGHNTSTNLAGNSNDIIAALMKDTDYQKAKEQMDEAKFKAEIHTCFFCEENINNDYDTAYVVDGDLGVCDSCMGVAIVNNIPVNKSLKGY